MNARAEPSALALPVRLTSPYEKTIVVSPWGFPIEASYEYDAGEPARISGGPDNWQPGTPPNAFLLSCRIEGVDVTEMISSDQRERLEEAILDALE